MSEAAAVTTTAEPAAPVQATEPVAPVKKSLSEMTKEERIAWRSQVRERNTGSEPEPPAPLATQAQPTGDEADEFADTPENPLGKPRNDWRARTKQELDRRKAAEARAERAERLAADLAAKMGAPAKTEPATATTAAPVDTGEPKLDDFLDQPDPIAAHTKALIQWAFDQRDQQHQIEQLNQKASQTITDIGKAGQAQYADWAERQMSEAASIVMPAHVVEAITLDLPPDLSARVLYHFSEHPDEARAIAAMEPRAAVLRIGTLAAQAPQPKAAPAKASPTTVSAAEAPGTTLGNRAAAPVDDLEAARQTYRRTGDYRVFREAFNRHALAQAK